MQNTHTIYVYYLIFPIELVTKIPFYLLAIFFISRYIENGKISVVSERLQSSAAFGPYAIYAAATSSRRPFSTSITRHATQPRQT